MILVTGGTGTVGGRVLEALAEAGVRARALVRSEEKGARAGELGHEPVVGDLADRESVARALDGVERLFLLTPSAPWQVDLETGAIDAAAAAGARHVVKVSAIGVGMGEKVRLFHVHEQIEAHLQGSGLAYTLLRPTDYMDNLLNQAHPIVQDGMFFSPLQPDVRIASIDARDVAAVAVRALGGDLENEALRLSGPEAPSRTELAEKVSRTAGRDVRFVSVPGAGARDALLRAGLLEWVVDGLIEGNEHFFAPGHGAEIQDTAEAAGATPHTWDDFLSDHAGAFRPTG